MADNQHLQILAQGIDIWNQWRAKNSDVKPDLVDASLSGEKLSGADFYLANLEGASLQNTDLRKADLSYASLIEADLTGADLSGSRLFYTNLHSANLDVVKLNDADLGYVMFGNNDLSTVIGLDSIFQRGPSSIGIDTIYQSGGNISDVFLRGAGVPDEFITYARSLVGNAIEFHSCFISYSHEDEEFAKRLSSRLKKANIRVWFAPEEMKSGERIHDQIDRAIHLHDKLLIVLSRHSLQSDWVMTEIRKARKAETKENRRKLFPIRLVSFDRIKKWECIDTDTGRDIAVEVREYFIPDFTKWKDDEAFEIAFDRLLHDLRLEEKMKSRT